jgi:hypothetical protein
MIYRILLLSLLQKTKYFLAPPNIYNVEDDYKHFNNVNNMNNITDKINITDKVSISDDFCVISLNTRYFI